MKGSIRGRALNKPVVNVSGAGRNYSKVSLRVTTKGGEDLIECMAFDQVAEELANLVDPGFSLICTGRAGSDGLFFISNFIVPKHGSSETGRAKNYVLAPPPVHRIEYLMDVLGAAYVTRRVREFTKASPQNLIKGYTPATRLSPPKRLGGFDLKRYGELMEELEKEAKEVADGAEALRNLR